LAEREILTAEVVDLFLLAESSLSQVVAILKVMAKLSIGFDDLERVEGILPNNGERCCREEEIFVFLAL
jgi:hypothetical protein